MIEIARELIALMVFLLLRDDFNISFNRLKYSFLMLLFISDDLISSASRIPKYL